MTFDAHKNFAVTTLVTAPSPATLGTTIVVTDASGFPAAPFNATLWPANALATAANAEVVRVGTVTSGTFHIARAQEASTAGTFAVGAQIANTITAKVITDIEASSGVVPATTVATSGSSQALSTPSTGDSAYDITLTANCTLSISGTGSSGKLQRIHLILRQDGTGGWTVTWPSVTWLSGVQPMIPLTASSVTEVVFSTVDGGTTWLGEQQNPAGGAAAATVATDETTASTTYTDLATAGPAVTVQVGPSGVVLVGLAVQIQNVSGWMSFAISGANTLAASDSNAVGLLETGIHTRLGATNLLTGLSAGSTTFTAKYRAQTGNTADFLRRTIWAIAL